MCGCVGGGGCRCVGVWWVCACMHVSSCVMFTCSMFMVYSYLLLVHKGLLYIHVLYLYQHCGIALYSGFLVCICRTQGRGSQFLLSIEVKTIGELAMMKISDVSVCMFMYLCMLLG